MVQSTFTLSPLRFTRPSTTPASGYIFSFMCSLAASNSVSAVVLTSRLYSFASPFMVSVPGRLCKFPSRVTRQFFIAAASPSLSFVSPSGFSFSP